MEVIANLQKLTEQINERRFFWKKTEKQHSVKAELLSNYLKNILKHLEKDLTEASENETLAELDLNLSPDEIKKIALAAKEKKEVEAEKVSIEAEIDLLGRTRHKILLDNHAVLEDFETEFWNCAIQNDANYEFRDSELEITFGRGKFTIPYRRFSEPKGKIVEEIKPLVEKRNAQNELKRVRADQEAWEYKMEREREARESEAKRLEEIIRKSNSDHNL